jgi:hypothetical protein
MIEAKYVFLLFDHRYAHINLPTMRGLHRMMVMVVRGLVVHVERQYTNANGIWQARECFGIDMIASLEICEPNYIRSHLLKLSSNRRDIMGLESSMPGIVVINLEQ